ncbi:MAG: DUF5666 domain-containing protein [Ktedonobacteraceae bacterium]
MHRFSMMLPKNVLYLSLGLFLLALAGCGSTPTTTSTLSSPNATATACAQATRPATSVKTTTGILKNINGQTLVVTNNAGNDVTVTYSDKTRFTQITSIAPSALQEGTTVRVAVTSNSGSYSATSITVVAGTNGNGFPRGNGTPGTGRRGNNPCAQQAQGTPTGNGTKGFRGLVGTVSQLNGSTLTITETTGSSYTVTITPQTRIVGTQSATATDLKIGILLTVAGRANSQGAIAANTVAILPNTPNATTTPVE